MSFPYHDKSLNESSSLLYIYLYASFIVPLPCPPPAIWCPWCCNLHHPSVTILITTLSPTLLLPYLLYKINIFSLPLFPLYLFNLLLPSFLHPLPSISICSHLSWSSSLPSHPSPTSVSFTLLSSFLSLLTSESILIFIIYPSPSSWLPPPPSPAVSELILNHRTSKWQIKTTWRMGWEDNACNAGDGLLIAHGHTYISHSLTFPQTSASIFFPSPDRIFWKCREAQRFYLHAFAHFLFASYFLLFIW